MAEIVARGPLAVGQLLDVTYKLGPARTRVQYRITRYEPGRLLRYETTDRHPLSGYATVTVLSVGGASLCGWEGEYRVKRWWSFASLAWFKLWYEPVFFGRLRIAFKRREALASRARAAA